MGLYNTTSASSPNKDRERLIKEMWAKVNVGSMSDSQKQSMQSTIERLAESKMREGRNISKVPSKTVGDVGETSLSAFDVPEAPDRGTVNRIEPKSGLFNNDVDLSIKDGIAPAFSSSIPSMSEILPMPKMKGRTAMEAKKDAVASYYDNFVNAETAGAAKKDGTDNYWKRTASNGGATEGSSAFGPVQITRNLIRDTAADPDTYGFTSDDLRAMEFFQAQGDEFLKYGNEPGKEGYSVEFDYSKQGGEYGKGWFGNSDEAKAKRHEYGGEEFLKKGYKSFTSKIMKHYSDKNEGNKDAVMKAWRFGEGSEKTIAKNDPKYGERFSS